MRFVPTGETYADVWSRSTDTERQTILAANIAVLDDRKGTRGRRGLDADRILLIAQPAVDTAADALGTVSAGRTLV